MTRTAALVIAWHEVELTVAALASIARSETAPDHVICVAQQFTPDERSDFDRHAPPGVDTLFLDDNLGFAAAANLGVERAAASGAEWVLVLNNDATVSATCLTECLAAATASPRVGAVSPAVVFMDRPDHIWWAGGRLSNRWGITRHPGLDQSVGQLPRSGDTEFIPGCCVLYSVEAWKQLGGYRESFFMYYEDADWCLRARASGWRLLYLARPLCRHAVGASSGQHHQNALGTNSAYFLARNPLRAAIDTADLRTRVTRVAGVLLVWNGYNGLRIVRNPGRLAVFRAYARGVIDALRNRMGPRGHYDGVSA